MAAVDTESAPLTLESLPTDPLLLILSFLDYRDLIKTRPEAVQGPGLRSVESPLSQASARPCGKRGGTVPRSRPADPCALHLPALGVFAGFGQPWPLWKGPHPGRVLFSARVPDLRSRAPEWAEGAREEDLDAVEAQIGCKLPDDYRCSYRIHNGQKLVVPGLLGSMALSNHYRSEDLLDVDTAAGGFQQRQGLKYCLPLTFCIHTGLSQYIAVEAAEGRNKNEVFYQCPDQMARNPAAIDMFIIGATFTDWFTSYVNNVVSGGFPIIRDQIFRYVHDPECVATTGDITVSVSTSFLPELSSVHPPHYFFTYRIRIEMSKDALPEKACQLDSRYWRITNAKGDVEEVQGPGVVDMDESDEDEEEERRRRVFDVPIRRRRCSRLF
ncbi:F-box only protein 3 isoform 2 isoform 4-like protein [Camelus ferus]|nr:F-box only protein 3 isoform 2 isoform 4-like protein [Camelus ferus]